MVPIVGTTANFAFVSLTVATAQRTPSMNHPGGNLILCRVIPAQQPAGRSLAATAQRLEMQTIFPTLVA